MAIVKYLSTPCHQVPSLYTKMMNRSLPYLSMYFFIFVYCVFNSINYFFDNLTLKFWFFPNFFQHFAKRLTSEFFIRWFLKSMNVPGWTFLEQLIRTSSNFLKWLLSAKATTRCLLKNYLLFYAHITAGECAIQAIKLKLLLHIFKVALLNRIVQFFNKYHINVF